MDRTPKPGEFYRHFKDKIYQVICLAHHSETGEALVIYQALYGEFKICARPLDMFISEVDHEKYPEVTQKYRFERISADKLQRVSAVKEDSPDNSISNKLTSFLDAETYNEKLMVLESMKDCMSEELVDSIAMALDLSIKPGAIEDEYGQLIYGLKTLMRFEDTRLR